MIRLISLLVPATRRAEWREEWESEIWHAAAPGGGLRLLAKCQGALPHAIWLRVMDVDAMSSVTGLRRVLRTLRGQPLFVTTALLTLGLGIGGTTALFSLVNGILLRPLPLQEPDRLVWMWGSFSRGQNASVSPPDFLDYRSETRAFESIAAMHSFPRTVMIGGGDAPEEVSMSTVTSNFFETLGVKPLIGRAFTEAETAGESSEVALVGESLWRRRFGGDPGILGGTILIDGRSIMVVGVVPAAHAFPQGSSIWLPVPFANEDYSVRGAHFLRPIGRLRAGVSLAAARADMDDIAARLEAAYPRSNTTWKLRLVPLTDAVSGNLRAPLYTLLGAVVLVLLVACANVAGLQLARASARRGEIAVRTALGASRLRVFRQLLAESFVIALLAGLLGIAIARGLLSLIVGTNAIALPRVDAVGLDGSMLVVSLLLSLVTGCLFGLAPALHLSRDRLSSVLRQTARDAGSGGRLRSFLVVAEIALAVVLLASASLLIRSFTALRSEPTGFETGDRLVARVRFPAGQYADAAVVSRTLQAMLDRVRSVPGVEGAGAINALPSVEFSGDTRLYAQSRPPADENDWHGAQVRVVSDGYFAAMGIPLERGRAVDRSDVRGATPIVVINDALSQALFGDDDPIGEVLMIGVGTPAPFTVAGVVGDVRQNGLGSPPSAEFYLPISQNPFAVPSMTIAIRTSGDPASFATAVRDAIRSVDAQQALSLFQPLEDALAGTVAQPRFRMALLSLFAAIALVLCSIGVYGVLAFSVTRRTREIGIRMALGERAASVMGSVVGRGMMLTSAGIVIGVIAAAASSRLLESVLYGVDARDAGSMAVTILTILAVAVIASALPALRAARIDPARALRSD